MPPDTTETVTALLVQRLPNLAGAWLFGSAARGDARADSDLDIAVFAGRPVAPAALAATRDALEAALNRDIDLVDLQGASAVLAFAVATEGRRIVALDPFVADLWEIRAMRDYEDMKRRRAGIEADIAARGKVFVDG